MAGRMWTLPGSPVFQGWLRLPKGNEPVHRIASDSDLTVPALAHVVARDQDHEMALDLLHYAHMSVHHPNGAWLRGCGLPVVRPIPRDVRTFTDPHRHLPSAPSMRPASRIAANVSHRAMEQRRCFVLAQHVLVDVVAQFRVSRSR